MFVDHRTIVPGTSDDVGAALRVPRCKTAKGKHFWNREDPMNVFCMACGMTITVREKKRK